MFEKLGGARKYCLIGVLAVAGCFAPLRAQDPVIAAAGDIACPSVFDPQNPNECQQMATSDVLGVINPDLILPLGDLQYELGEYRNFLSFYDPSWGRWNSISRPAVGNHEYEQPGARGYFDYFNGIDVYTGPAGDRDKGYYSFDVGAWHLIALNSNCAYIGGCNAGSAQEQWLRADLAAHPGVCVLAYFHRPLFSSGWMGDDFTYQDLWRALYDFGADLVLNGHDHLYERFAPQTPDGVADPVGGIREFVVGTGGRSLFPNVTYEPTTEVTNDSTFGVLTLTLHPTSYDWQFVPIAGGIFTDQGSTSCHNPLGHPD